MSDQSFAQAGQLATDQIPLIDISGIGHENGLENVAAQIHRAATEVGFFYIAGHGIDPALMERAFATTQRFFALPEADKATVAVDQDQRGWMAQGMSTLQGAATHDLKEVFFWGRETPADDADLRAGKDLVAQNRWPEAACPDLQKDLQPYYNAVCGVAGRILEAVAVSLGLPQNWFAPHYVHPLARGQLVYYPPSTVADDAEQRFGVAPHTDFGVLTCLLQDNSGGLQVRTRGGEWIEAPPIPGTLVCNIGDLLQRWTNDRFSSTVHRVINRSGAERYSIPVFFDPHPDTLIDPCDLGTDPAASRYEPITAGAHIVGRNQRSFAQHQSKPRD